MKVISLVVGLTVGVLLMVGLVSPVVVDGQKTAGTEITYENANVGTYTLHDSTDVVTFERLADDTILVNGESVQKSDGFALASDSISVYVAFSGRWYIVDQTSEILSFGATATTHIKVTYSNGTVTFNNLDNPAQDKTETYTWLYAPSENGEWITAYMNSGRDYRVNTINDVICTGYYSSGELDTGYIFKNGTLTLEEDYAGSVDYSLVPVENTTDMFKLTDFKINVGNENFVPWCTLIKGEISGHETSGANYALLGAIPIVAFIALIAFTAFAVRGRMDD